MSQEVRIVDDDGREVPLFLLSSLGTQEPRPEHERKFYEIFVVPERTRIQNMLAGLIAQNANNPQAVASLATALGTFDKASALDRIAMYLNGIDVKIADLSNVVRDATQAQGVAAQAVADSVDGLSTEFRQGTQLRALVGALQAQSGLEIARGLAQIAGAIDNETLAGIASLPNSAQQLNAYHAIGVDPGI
jgi:hypothetical protein